jgi:hypothetical protein
MMLAMISAIDTVMMTSTTAAAVTRRANTTTTTGKRGDKILDEYLARFFRLLENKIYPMWTW